MMGRKRVRKYFPSDTGTSGDHALCSRQSRRISKRSTAAWLRPAWNDDSTEGGGAERKAFSRDGSAVVFSVVAPESCVARGPSKENRCVTPLIAAVSEPQIII